MQRVAIVGEAGDGAAAARARSRFADGAAARISAAPSWRMRSSSTSSWRFRPRASKAARRSRACRARSTAPLGEGKSSRRRARAVSLHALAFGRLSSMPSCSTGAASASADHQRRRRPGADAWRLGEDDAGRGVDQRGARGARLCRGVAVGGGPLDQRRESRRRCRRTGRVASGVTSRLSSSYLRGARPRGAAVGRLRCRA